METVSWAKLTDESSHSCPELWFRWGVWVSKARVWGKNTDGICLLSGGRCRDSVQRHSGWSASISKGKSSLTCPIAGKLCMTSERYIMRRDECVAHGSGDPSNGLVVMDWLKGLLSQMDVKNNNNCVRYSENTNKGPADCSSCSCSCPNQLSLQ